MFDFLIPVAFFAFLAAIIITPQVLRARDRARMYDVMRLAYEKGQPVPPEFVDAFGRPMARTRAGEGRDTDVVPPFTADPAVQHAARGYPGADRDLRRGVVLISVGVGLVLVGAAFYAGLYTDGGASETFGTFAAAGAIPGCMGLANLGLWWFHRRKVKA